MNPIVLNEQQTRTIKYINQTRHLEDQQSESITQKQYEQEMNKDRRKNTAKKNNQEKPLDAQALANKILVAQMFDQIANQRETTRNLAHPPKIKHKKGKSMDIEDFKALSKEERRYFIDSNDSGENKAKIKINNDYLNDFKDRSSISQMKQYNFSKKLGVLKKPKDENLSTNKRKKSKSIHEGEIKQVKRQIKAIFDATPLHLNWKKKQASSKSSKTSRSNSNNPFGKGASKQGAKSYQISTERKVKSAHHKQKSKSGLVELRNIAESMPITSKMVSLYSNTSSLFSSKSELEKVNRRQSYVIPTEQSIDEISQIRKYESLSLRKRSSDNIRKISLINQLEDEDVYHKQSTEHIISQYLELLNSNELEFEKHVLSHDFELSQIPHQNSLKQKNDQINSEMMLGSLNLAEMHEIAKENRIVLQKSEVVHQLSSEISHQQQQLSKLNEIIEIIQRKDNKDSLNKEEILHQIKGLLAKSYQEKAAKQQQELSKIHEEHFDEAKDNSKNDLSSSGLKQSLNFEENMEGVNLQILDKTLRQRESYLIEKKQKELQRFEEHHKKDEGWQKERQKIQKWMNHQIKQVVHIRKQLWKGFNIAKSLIVPENNKKESKKNEMIKCLSDKYLAKTYRLSKKDSQVLSKGRVNEVDSSEDLKQSSHSSDIHIELKADSEDESDEQLLDSSSKLKNQFNQYKNKFLQNQNRVNFEGQSSTESVDREKPLNNSPKLLQPPTIGILPSAGGLNLQKIQCEIDYQDSLNSQQMQALAKQSQKVKNESLKIPYELSVEDKQDIYEFIFLDLCIELTDEYPHDSTVMKKISSFIKNMKEQSKKQKGFKTNTNAIRDYLFQFITFLKSKPEQLEEVHLNIEKPLGPTALDILKYMHVYDQEPIEDDNNDTVFILDIKLFESFEQTYLNALQFEKYYDDEEKEKKRKTFLKNAIHIHNKSIFDALNETLDRERPFGVWGQPFSWKKIAKFYHQRDVAIKNSLILKSAQKTIEFGAYMCGFIADKEDCNLKNNPNVTQAYIDQIRDDRLSRLLANELDESEEKMLFIDDEETEILVEVGQVILQNLFAEMCREVAALF